MSPSVHGKSPHRRYSSDRSDSPARGHASPPRRKISPRKERSPPPRRKSSPRTRSPVRTSSSHRTRSPAREKMRGRGRSPKNKRSSSPDSMSPSPHSRHSRQAQTEREMERMSKREREKNSIREEDQRMPPKNGRSELSASRSPSPRTKRLRRAQVERETEKRSDRERDRHSSRDGDKVRHRERGPDKEAQSERSTMREKNDGVSSRSRDSRHDRSTSPVERGHRSRYGSRSPPRGAKAGARDEGSNPRGAEQRDGEHDDSVAKMKAAEEALEAKQKQKPSFELSGKLAAETNRVRGVTLLFTEPPDARKPDIRWRLYVFKAGEVLNEPLYVHRQTCYLFGRERRVADIPTDHPSCSKQHAVIQYRLVEKEQPNGMLSKQVRPYLMDLGSTNGTFINDNRIEPQRYYELIEKDTIKFGNSSREYVILHENSAE
ncbi:hypothetical protein AAC387_Pa05g2583 [Persea americana]